MTASNPTVTVTRYFDFPIERVFDAWLDPARASRFLFATPTGTMVRADIDARVGGSFNFTDRRDGEDIEHVGTYLEIDRPRRLVFTFGVPKFSSQMTRVTIELKPSGTGCDLTLTHEGVLPEYLDRTREGWGKIVETLAGNLSKDAAYGVIVFDGVPAIGATVGILEVAVVFFVAQQLVGRGDFFRLLVAWPILLLPILSNTATALLSIDPVLRKVSVGMGLTAWQRLRYMELPLAAPTILVGIKTAAVINIGTATLAAFIGAGGLGEPIVTGLALNDPSLILQGDVPAALLAVITELAFELLQRVVVPKHLLQKAAE